MLYANIYFTIFLLLIAMTLFSYLLALKDWRRWEIWLHICLISAIIAFAMVFCGFLYAIWS
jgi:hypothetical protein